MQPEEKPVVAYVALGANLGHREKHLLDAIDRLRETPGVRVSRISRFLENPAVGGPPDSPPFLNAVMQIETTLAPRELLSRLHEIERMLGRTRRTKWEPRMIDLDLLLYGDLVLTTPDLTIPHPLLHERRFVLEPLAEIAADVVHPLLHQTARDLFAQLPL